jgi:Protein of unknown function (DUF3638)
MHGSELIIRTRTQDQIYELVPTHALLDDFPRAFVQDYTHWLNINTEQIEWRPLKYAWAPSSDDWRFRKDGHETFVLSRGAQKAIDIRSPTARAISQILSPLEHATHIHIALDRRTRALEVSLPRMNLDFLLRDSQSLLESKQFRSMIVDERQSFGAFTGLVNKLVLRSIDRQSRCVLVPYGSVSFAPEGHHVRVMISTAPGLHVKYHSYDIDSQLGRLVDNGNLNARLFKIYLRATTSHCLVDQLTRRTGTEEALQDLASGTTRSFVDLEPANIELLEQLAQLTPRRTFYPDHLQVMQQVGWKSLSPLAQHYAFYEQVTSVFEQAKSFQVFQERPLQLPTLDTRGKPFLLERAAIRESPFQVHGFGADAFTIDQDTIYRARDQFIDIDREIRACQTAKLVDDWSTSLVVCPRLLSEIESWGQPLVGPACVDDLTLGFDLEWLEKKPSSLLPRYWCTLHDLLSNSVVERDKYRVMIFLSTFSYSPHAKQELIMTLLAFATSPELRMLRPPRYQAFQLADGYRPVLEKLTSLAEQHARHFNACPEHDLPKLRGETKRAADTRRTRLYQVAKAERARVFAKDLIAQWPISDVSTPTGTDLNTYLNVQQVMNEARPYFQSLHRNAQFQRYAQQVQGILDNLPRAYEHVHKYSFTPPVDRYSPRRTHVNFLDLTHSGAPCLPAPDPGNFDNWIVRGDKQSTDHSKLKELLAEISSQCSNKHEQQYIQQYIQDLRNSFDAMRQDSYVGLKDVPELTLLLEAHFTLAQRHVRVIYQKICDQLLSGSHALVRVAQMLPRLSPIVILSHLASDKVSALPLGWKEALVQYALSTTALQRAERLLASAGNKIDLLSELENPGHQNWNPMHHPEWLLFEIENNILIRQEQVSIARETMTPSLGSNSVSQLNMGLGKSSVIVPISATDLADGTQLVRVIVLRPLAMQMFQLLAKKLGGLLNRRVVYVPISRSLSLNAHQGRQIYQLFQECKQSGSILLLQPEHILSFELMGLERVLNGDLELGNILIETQDWLYAHSRDILDESDEILSVRFELIYTMGVQRAIDFSPERWKVIQCVLGNLGCSAQQVLERFPNGLEVLPAPPGAFPRIRILQAPAGEELLETVARQLCEDGLPGVPVWSLPKEIKTALFTFLTDPGLGAAAALALQESWSGSMRSSLLLLRGLFACGILRFAFEQKRWRVNYGLDPVRTMLAVP